MGARCNSEVPYLLYCLGNILGGALFEILAEESLAARTADLRKRLHFPVDCISGWKRVTDENYAEPGLWSRMEVIFQLSNMLLRFSLENP